MKKITVLAIMSLILTMNAKAQYEITPQVKQRACELVSKMTLEEKVELISGKEDGFHTAAIERLGIPSVRMADGPQGVRNNTHSTYYPCGILLAATFNREAAEGVGTGIGFDASARGVRVMLCPGVNIHRSPYCGRNFEYYGEDPYLASETAVNYIKGIQSKRVVSTIKHFAGNNQEYRRHWTSSAIDERTLNEIYFPTFKKAVQQAHVGAVMTSYNPLNGLHAAENAELIKGNLRAWGHEGIVMSDWLSTYTTLGTLTSGLDLEMPVCFVTGMKDIRPLLDNGVIEEAYIDEMCLHILQTFIAFGLLDEPAVDESIPEDYEYSRNMAYNASVEGPVLLTNNGLLPLKGKSAKNIVVLGPNADIVAFGGGSGSMSPIEGRNTTIFAGMKALGKGYKVTLLDCNDMGDEQMKAISKASAVIFAAGFNHDTEYEEGDRTYALPDNQNELILKVAEANPNVIVTVNSGGEVDINPWKDKVAAIIMAWYGGQEGGKALADIISGRVAPSGRLPFTFWGSEEKNPSHAFYHEKTPVISAMLKDRDPYPFATYGEGVFMGYRAVEHFGVEPMFPFGFGLSYTSFEYGNLNVEKAGDGYDVSFTVRNTGKTSAKETAQVYVAPVNPSVLRPARELKGYAKKEIAKGGSEVYTVHLDRDAFAHYDIRSHSWKVDEGKYIIQVGRNSGEILLEAALDDVK